MNNKCRAETGFILTGRMDFGSSLCLSSEPTHCPLASTIWHVFQPLPWCFYFGGPSDWCSSEPRQDCRSQRVSHHPILRYGPRCRERTADIHYDSRQRRFSPRRVAPTNCPYAPYLEHDEECFLQGVMQRAPPGGCLPSPTLG